jgi:hypothetical protein
MEKIVGLFGFITTLLALASGFDSFTNTALHWRLLVTGAACLSLSWVFAGHLASWTKPRQEMGFEKPVAKRSWLKFLASAVSLAICCALFVFLSWWLLIDRITFQLHETRTAAKSSALLIAPYSTLDSVTIELPSFKETECAWTDKDLQLSQVDINSPTPKLEIDNFEYPQRIAIECSLPTAIQNVTAKPASITIYRTDQLSWWRHLSAIVGGLIWLIAVVRLWFLSR